MAKFAQGRQSPATRSFARSQIPAIRYDVDQTTAGCAKAAEPFCRKTTGRAKSTSRGRRHQPRKNKGKSDGGRLTLVKGRSSSVMRSSRDDVWCIFLSFSDLLSGVWVWLVIEERRERSGLETRSWRRLAAYGSGWATAVVCSGAAGLYDCNVVWEAGAGCTEGEAWLPGSSRGRRSAWLCDGGCRCCW